MLLLINFAFSLQEILFNYLGGKLNSFDQQQLTTWSWSKGFEIWIYMTLCVSIKSMQIRENCENVSNAKGIDE